MRDEWGRRPEIIEGEYEVIEEWDAGGTYYRRKKRNFRLNPDMPYITYGILALNIGIWLIMSFVGTVFGLDLYNCTGRVLAPIYRHVLAYRHIASFF